MDAYEVLFFLSNVLLTILYSVVIVRDCFRCCNCGYSAGYWHVFIDIAATICAAILVTVIVLVVAAVVVVVVAVAAAVLHI